MLPEMFFFLIKKNFFFLHHSLHVFNIDLYQNFVCLSKFHGNNHGQSNTQKKSIPKITMMKKKKDRKSIKTD